STWRAAAGTSTADAAGPPHGGPSAAGSSRATCSSPPWGSGQPRFPSERGRSSGWTRARSSRPRRRSRRAGRLRTTSSRSHPEWPAYGRPRERPTPIGARRRRRRAHGGRGPTGGRVTQARSVSSVVLGIGVVVLACVVVALPRQIGVLYERVAPAGALLQARGPVVGAEAPVIEVEDLRGDVRAVGGTRGDGRSTLLFFLSPTCPVFMRVLPGRRSVRRRQGSRLAVLPAPTARVP